MQEHARAIFLFGGLEDSSTNERARQNIETFHIDISDD